jgi:hypothetical protein
VDNPGLVINILPDECTDDFLSGCYDPTNEGYATPADENLPEGDPDA